MAEKMYTLKSSLYGGVVNLHAQDRCSVGVLDQKSFGTIWGSTMTLL